MNISKNIMVCASALTLVASSMAFAHENSNPGTAYLIDSRGHVVHTQYGNCIRTSEWTPATAIKECDPSLFPEDKVVPPKVEGKAVAPKEMVTPAAPEKLNFSAASLFDFDKAIVKPEGKKALDKLAADLAGTNYDAISVTGHTDRIGSDAYNQKLSERRADAVKTYLAESAKIEPAKIFTSGKGKTDPVTKAGECKGNKKTKKLIACLAPDRRVVVEVSATRK